MADSITFRIEGVEALNAKLKGVSDDVRLKGGRFALRKAANLVRDQAKANAARVDDPTTNESIAKNIAVRWDGKHFKRTGDLKFRVGVLGGAMAYGDTRLNRRKSRVGKEYGTDGSSGNPGGDTWYWRFLEFGTSRQRAQPFMRTALASSIDAATAEFVNQYGKAVDRAIKRAAKKAEGS
ncbi:HK97-gp10 family putative phage morphogenesis protein [Salinicola sp. CPA57]|uniref:HK97-gp10 family putative phage morphogenesis protein n=1 Tax=Salinicola sp. CPA57 TaxID=1949080 RepID=UPI000DA19EF0|nr:HK97-gp10 family putative phage morphogenesis protein [Salinicola sp. CPA57]